ncbi:MAG: DUF4062 domain-containing protein [Candidatus Glassbacteria bacterium]
MPKNIKMFRVFVASPNDVVQEREALEEVIRELNCGVCERDSIKLELIKWETHCYPDFGEDAQDVINKQIVDYDFFIGILWTKIGTPTKRSESGTIEEFTKAYERYKCHRNVVILFYFKESEINPFAIDLEQFKKVVDFKNNLKELGCLYFPFNDLNKFSSLVRIHLTMHLKDLINKRTRLESVENSSETTFSRERKIIIFSDSSTEVENDKLLEIFEENIFTYSGILTDVGRMTIELGILIEKINNRTRRIKGSEVEDYSIIIKNFDELAEGLDKYAQGLNNILQDYELSFNATIDAISRLIKEFPNADKDLQQEIRTKISGLEKSLLIYEIAKNGNEEFLGLLKNSNYVTPKANKVRREAAKSVEKFQTETFSNYKIFSEIVKTFKAIDGILY